jgi:hypothetical protein
MSTGGNLRALYSGARKVHRVGVMGHKTERTHRKAPRRGGDGDSVTHDRSGKIVARNESGTFRTQGQDPAPRRKVVVHESAAGGALILPTDTASRRSRAEKALAGHPRKAAILASVNIRDPKPQELEIAAILKGRARAALARDGRKAA